MSTDSQKRLAILWAEKFRDSKRPMSTKELIEIAEKAGIGYNAAFVSTLDMLHRSGVLQKREFHRKLEEIGSRRQLAPKFVLFWPKIMAISGPQISSLKKKFEFSCSLRPTEEERVRMTETSRDLDERISKEADLAKERQTIIEDAMDVDDTAEFANKEVENLAEKLNNLVGDICNDLSIMKRYYIASLKRMGISDEALELLGW